MHKNILIISASPRKGGNSETLCGEFEKGALQADNTVETVFLREQKIAPCLGCEYCTTHNGECVTKDGMAKILDKMINYDVIVFASPVYFYSINAQLKALIDRTVAKYTQIKNKEVCYILTAADPNEDNFSKAIECIRGFTLDCLDNAKERYIILGTGVWKKGEVNSSPAMKEAFEAGLNI